MEIEAVQFHRPHGEQEVITGQVDDALASQWAAIQAAGLRLEMEVLPGNFVSITLTDAPRDDYMIRVVPNDLDLPRTVEDMIRTFDVEELAAWRVEWDTHEAVTSDDPFGAKLTRLTEGMSVMLVELVDASIGHRVAFKIDGERLMFEVTGHSGEETHLRRVHDDAEARNDDFMASIDGDGGE
jgi:hypothetical protein